MKRFFGFALTLVLFAAPAFAGNKPQSVTLSNAVLVGSTQLPAGDYKLSWTGAGPDVQATLAQSGKAVVNFSAKLVEGKYTPAVGTDKQGEAVVLQTIQLNNAKLILEGATHAGQQ